jgi:hypothetical protein
MSGDYGAAANDRLVRDFVAAWERREYFDLTPAKEAYAIPPG